MAFWGLGKKGEQYRSEYEKMAPWQFEQAQDWAKRSRQLQERADPYQQGGYNYYLDVVQQGGLPAPGTIHQTGAQVLPGIPEAQERRWGRWADIQAEAGKIPSAEQTMGPIWENLKTRGDLINANQQQQDTIINDLTKQLQAAEAAGHQDVVDNIRDTLASLESLWGTEYGRLRKFGEETYGGLKASAEEAWGGALKDIERLRPGGEFQTAETARAYAPVIRGTAERLRRGGIEAGSAQGITALQRAETARARGMDEAAGRGISEYVAAKTSTTLGREAARQQLGLGQLGYETGLTQEQVKATAGARAQAGQDFRSEVIRSLGANQGISEGAAGAKSANLEKTLERNISLLGDKSKAAELSRSLGEGDWNRIKDILQGMNEEELAQLGLTGLQFEAGMKYTQYKLTREDQSMAQMMGMTNQDYSRAMTAAQIAQQSGRDAAQIYKELYGIEAANAGWGTKLILGTGIELLKKWLTGGFGGGGTTGTPGSTATRPDQPGYIGTGEEFSP